MQHMRTTFSVLTLGAFFLGEVAPLLASSEDSTVCESGVCTAVQSQTLMQVRSLSNSAVYSQLVCPPGTEQVGDNKADIPGCGLTFCHERYSAQTIEGCKNKCAGDPRCIGFTWAPVGGDQNHLGETVCTIYDLANPTHTWGPNQIFCRVGTTDTTTLWSDGGLEQAANGQMPWERVGTEHHKITVTETEHHSGNKALMMEYGGSNGQDYLKPRSSYDIEAGETVNFTMWLMVASSLTMWPNPNKCDLNFEIVPMLTEDLKWADHFYTVNEHTNQPHRENRPKHHWPIGFCQTGYDPDKSRPNIPLVPNTWQRVSFTVTALESVKRVKFYFAINWLINHFGYEDLGQPVIYVDDFSVTKVPSCLCGDKKFDTAKCRDARYYLYNGCDPNRPDKIVPYAPYASKCCA